LGITHDYITRKQSFTKNREADMTHRVVGTPIVGLLLFITLLWTHPVFAVPFTPGTGGFINGVVPPSGVVLDTLSDPFQLRDDTTPSIILATGMVTSQVIREDATGLLRFEYQVFVDPTSPGRVEFLIAFNFGPFLTDVDFILGGSGNVAPTEAIRSINTFAVSFIFPGSGRGGGLQPGESSLPLFVRTNATQFDRNGIIRVQQDLNIEDNPRAFQPIIPSSPIPEPSTMLLLGTGLAGLASWRTMRKKG
jgi:hypothetical protein